MGLTDLEVRQRLSGWLVEELEADSVEITGFRRLAGGAIQDNFALTLDIGGGRCLGTHALVLRTDAPSGVAASLSRPQEFRVLETAWRAGVKVPEPFCLCEDSAVIGTEFYLMRLVPGTASPRELVRGTLSEERREALVEALGVELAGIHELRPPMDELDFLQPPDSASALARVEKYRRYLDAIPNPRPVTEWALRWLELNAPASEAVSLCHSDYRTGNYLVADGSLSAILDWEFADWGDPLEDIGWFCARCWRFGAWGREAGGIGSRDAFYRGYETASGRVLDRAQIAYWEVMATVRWAVIALQQAQRHLSGGQGSLELALTGRKVPEMELDMLMEIERIESGAAAHA